LVELGKIAGDDNEELKARELSIWVCIRYLQQLKNCFKENPPKDVSEEIEFFKCIKPKFKATLLYHQMMYNIACRKPFGGSEQLVRFYKKELEVLARYHEENIVFWQ